MEQLPLEACRTRFEDRQGEPQYLRNLVSKRFELIVTILSEPDHPGVVAEVGVAQVRVAVEAELG